MIRNEREIRFLQTVFAIPVCTVTFTAVGEGPLSWKLSSAQKTQIETDWLNTRTQAVVDSLVRDFQDPVSARQAGSPDCLPS
jgi:hypothetical protein